MTTTMRFRGEPRPLSSAELLRLAELDPTKGGAKGVLYSLRQRATNRERAVIDEITPTRRKRERYDSPFNRNVGAVPENLRKPLSASDLEWLKRLPRDPAKVPADAVHTLRDMAARVQPTELGRESGDARLVASILEPIRQYHERQRLQVEIAELRRSKVVEPPAGLTAVLADAIASENPELTEREAGRRADHMIVEAVERRREERRSNLAVARDALATLGGSETRSGLSKREMARLRRSVERKISDLDEDEVQEVARRALAAARDVVAGRRSSVTGARSIMRVLRDLDPSLTRDAAEELADDLLERAEGLLPASYSDADLRGSDDGDVDQDDGELDEVSA